jgi:hypothetical protein
VWGRRESADCPLPERAGTEAHRTFTEPSCDPWANLCAERNTRYCWSSRQCRSRRLALLPGAIESALHRSDDEDEDRQSAEAQRRKEHGLGPRAFLNVVVPERAPFRRGASGGGHGQRRAECPLTAPSGRLSAAPNIAAPLPGSAATARFEPDGWRSGILGTTPGRRFKVLRS